jgi:hypothetical protein
MLVEILCVLDVCMSEDGFWFVGGVVVCSCGVEVAWRKRVELDLWRCGFWGVDLIKEFKALRLQGTYSGADAGI